jgi:hypothetical protein
MGIAVSLGSGVVHCRSAKLSMVTKSSFESEWVSMCEGTGYMYWAKSFLERCGFSFKDPGKRDIPKMFEDNLGAIWNAREELTFARNKHLLIKRNYVKEANDNNHMVIIHCDTIDMIADLLTKLLSERLTMKHMLAMGMERMDDY